MKKIIILIAAIAITGIVSAQVTFTSNLFQQQTAQVNAKSHIEITHNGTTVTNNMGTICSQEAIIITVWQRALNDDGTTPFATPTLTITTNPGAAFTSTAVSVAATKPSTANAAAYVCADNWTKWTFTIAAGTCITPGDYELTLNREEGVCGISSTAIVFTIGQPQVPVIAVANSPICEDGNITLNVTWYYNNAGSWEEADNNADGDGAPAPNAEDVIVTYVVEDLTCGTSGNWVAPSTVGLTSPLTVPSAGLTFPVNDPGRKNLHINSVSYTKTGCGTITINNTTTKP